MDKQAFEPASARSTVRRVARRASYDPAVVDAILDAGLIAHVAFVVEDQPFAIPMIYVRRGRDVIMHGAIASRLLRGGAAGVPMAVSVTLLDGIVYAKSAFHHSVNYRSVVLLGSAREVVDEAEKRACFDELIERVSPGRSKLVRAPNDKELAATRVIAMPITEASAKIRTGGPIDDAEDLGVAVWAGHLPLGLAAMSHVQAADDQRYALPAMPTGITLAP
ncbi:MAG TPA: pyridoxamine 5'-phosphate oxidase family protein [Kofleriaceae bacterium]|nr:pyridoxamine 5'-phosphate oxidase family protein [Kofleriaceae bacterium]